MPTGETIISLMMAGVLIAMALAALRAGVNEQKREKERKLADAEKVRIQELVRTLDKTLVAQLGKWASEGLVRKLGSASVYAEGNQMFVSAFVERSIESDSAVSQVVWRQAAMSFAERISKEMSFGIVRTEIYDDHFCFCFSFARAG